MKPTIVEKETKKGGSSSSGRPEMEALLRAIRAAKEAAEIRGGSVASYLGARAGAMEATFVSAFLRKCLISWRKVRLYQLTTTRLSESRSLSCSSKSQNFTPCSP